MTPAGMCPRCWRPVNGPGAQTCNRPHAADRVRSITPDSTEAVLTVSEAARRQP